MKQGREAPIGRQEKRIPKISEDEEVREKEGEDEEVLGGEEDKPNHDGATHSPSDSRNERTRMWLQNCFSMWLQLICIK